MSHSATISDLDGALTDLSACLRALVTTHLPTVAMVDGAAVGAGLGLAAACDVVLATGRATFGLPEVVFGLVPTLVLPVLQLRVAASALHRLGSVGDAMAAREALELGLVDHLSPPERLDAAVTQHTTRLLRSREAVPGRRLALRDTLRSRLQAGERALMTLLQGTDLRAAMARHGAGLAPLSGV